jgi:hypothetical protein
MEFAGMVARGEITLDTALHDHFTANMYPPVPIFFLPAAKCAIEACLAEDAEKMIELPDRDGVNRGPEPAHKVVEALRLGAFVMLQDIAHGSEEAAEGEEEDASPYEAGVPDA